MHSTPVTASLLIMKALLYVIQVICLLRQLCARTLPSAEQQQDASHKLAISPFSTEWANTIAICGIMRLENTQDVREWLQYHRCSQAAVGIAPIRACFRIMYIGVDHALLYDNSENGGVQAAELADFIQEGFLTYFTVPGEALQVPVYQHCLTQSGVDYTWLAAIDIDEFIVVEDSNARQGPPDQMLKSVLRDFRFYPGVVLQWKGFGPGGHIQRPEPGGPLEHYLSCTPLQWPPVKRPNVTIDARLQSAEAWAAFHLDMHGKSIANRHWTSHASTNQGFMYWGESMPVTDSFERVPPTLSTGSKKLVKANGLFLGDMKRRSRRLVLHHYVSRSFEEFKLKLARGSVDRPRADHVRDWTFFEAINITTFEHPNCKTALEDVEACCRDSEGHPWPPIPTGEIENNYKIHELQPADVPTLDDLNIDRGQDFREGHYPPFPKKTWLASSVICASWHNVTDESALLEWLDHHKHIGVTTIRLYSEDGEPDTPTEELWKHSQKFLQWASLADRGKDESESEFIRRECIEDFSKEYAFVTYIHTYDYIMPRGDKRTEEGQLERVLGSSEFRFGPGVVLPIFEFGRYDIPDPGPGGEIFPLRHFQTCNYFGHHLKTRTIANTYYVEAPLGHMGFKFVHGMLPITDSGRPWVPQLSDVPSDDQYRIFPNNIRDDESLLESEMNAFHLMRPFGDTLAVFSFLPEPSGAPQKASWHHRLRQYISHVHNNDPSCGEALEAADACCSWELEDDDEEDDGGGGADALEGAR